MPLLGDSKSVYVGTTPITKVMAGSVEVWPKGTLDPLDSDVVYLSHLDEWDYNKNEFEGYRKSSVIKSSTSKRSIDSSGKFNKCFSGVTSATGDEHIRANGIIGLFNNDNATFKNKVFNFDFWVRPYLNINYTSDLFRIYFDNAIGSQPTSPPYIRLFAKSGSPVNKTEFLTNCFQFNGISTNPNAGNQVVGIVDRDTWTHIAVYYRGDRKSFGYNVWINGVSPASSEFYEVCGQLPEDPYPVEYALIPTRQIGDVALYDELRVCDKAKYTGNFTPPTAPYQIYK